jgi:hypothetical protein
MPLLAPLCGSWTRKTSYSIIVLKSVSSWKLADELRAFAFRFPDYQITNPRNGSSQDLKDLHARVEQAFRPAVKLRRRVALAIEVPHQVEREDWLSCRETPAVFCRDLS